MLRAFSLAILLEISEKHSPVRCRSRKTKTDNSESASYFRNFAEGGFGLGTKVFCIVERCALRRLNYDDDVALILFRDKPSRDVNVQGVHGGKGEGECGERCPFP